VLIKVIINYKYKKEGIR